MGAQAPLDAIEGVHACSVCGAGCLSFADEIEDDIVLRIALAVAGGSQGQGHYPVANQPDAVRTIDFARGKTRLLLCKAGRDTDDPVEDQRDDSGDLHPCREP